MIIVIECDNCNGKGHYEELYKGCHLPTSMGCCGGCSETTDCDECEGSGEIEVDLLEYIEKPNITMEDICNFLKENVTIDEFRDFLTELIEE